jgi:hypothetical protein
MKKVGFIVLAVILALGLVGAAYAAFSQNLFAQANVQTGSVSVEWSSATTAVTGTNADVNGDLLSVGPIVYSNTLGGTDDTATITVSNAYPGAWVLITPVFYNDGNIPATVSLSNTYLDGNLLVSGVSPSNTVTIAPETSGSLPAFYVEVNPSSEANNATLSANFSIVAVSP